MTSYLIYADVHIPMTHRNARRRILKRHHLQRYFRRRVALQWAIEHVAAALKQFYNQRYNRQHHLDQSSQVQKHQNDGRQFGRRQQR